jgi:hypothetical protein
VAVGFPIQFYTPTKHGFDEFPDLLTKKDQNGTECSQMHKDFETQVTGSLQSKEVLCQHQMTG